MLVVFITDIYGAHLIHNILDVNWLQYLGLNDSVQIGVHKLKHQVDVLVIASSDDIQQLYHVLVRGKLLYTVSALWSCGVTLNWGAHLN